MKKWSFGFRVKQWFLSPRHWDNFYEAGDYREVVSMFYMDNPDVEKAKTKLRKDAESEDMMIEILGLEYKQEVEVPVYQQPIRI